MKADDNIYGSGPGVMDQEGNRSHPDSRTTTIRGENPESQSLSQSCDTRLKRIDPFWIPTDGSKKNPVRQRFKKDNSWRQEALRATFSFFEEDPRLQSNRGHSLRLQRTLTSN